MQNSIVVLRKTRSLHLMASWRIRYCDISLVIPNIRGAVAKSIRQKRTTHQPPKKLMHRSHVRHRNDTSRLVREIKRRLHGSLASRLARCLFPSPSCLLLFLPVRPLRVSTSTTQSRGSHPREPRGENVLRNRWLLSNIFLPVFSPSRYNHRARARSHRRARRIRRIRARVRYLRPVYGNHLPPSQARQKSANRHQSRRIRENGSR